jgi:apolipoprotein N-acyltransferase
VALVPLLAALVDGRPADPSADGPTPLVAFTLGLLTGVVYFVGTIYWTAMVMRQFGDLPLPVAVLLMVALAAYLAVYPALFALVMQRVISRFGPTALLLAPAVWVTTEYGRGYVFTGFPWVLLGYSQVHVLPVTQVASLFGVWGLSALIVFVNVALVGLVFLDRRWRWMTASAAALVLALAAAWGAYRVHDGRLTREGEVVRAGAIQGSVPQDEKWLQRSAGAILETYGTLTQDAAARGATLVLWPESALPFYFEEDWVAGARVRGLAAKAKISLLFGSDQLERGTPARYYNSAFMVDSSGAVRSVYRKVHLVPFGEYVPVKRLLFFAGPLVQQVSDFSAGERMVVMPVGRHLVSTEICYEVVYPDLAQRAVELGSELLTTITNDAWFGRSSAPWQHFDMAAMRAVEQGRYLVRAANTGISGFVDPYGRVLSRTMLFQPAAPVEDVRFLTGRTVYSRIGDALVYACGAATLAALLASVRRRSAAARA